MMAQILVRNLDDAVVESLKLSARRRGASLEQEVRRILAEAVSVTRADISRHAAALRARQAPNTSSAAALIRADRER
jgi:plasmid stability protein